MQIEVKLPPLGKDAPDKARVSFWLIDVGENVKEGEDLISMVTDKAAFDVPSPATGKLIETRVNEGDEVAVGQVIGIIERT